MFIVLIIFGNSTGRTILNVVRNFVDFSNKRGFKRIAQITYHKSPSLLGHYYYPKLIFSIVLPPNP